MKYLKTLLFLVLAYNTYGTVFEWENIPPTTLSGSITAIAVSATESAECNDGSISLDISNPNGPFYIQWSNGEITETINNLSPGEYCVTVTDNLCGEARGCWQVKCCPFILEEDDFQINISHPACEDQNGALEVSFSNIPSEEFPLNIYLDCATDNKKYDLALPSANSTLPDLPIGEYSAQILYGEGCSNNFGFSIEQKQIEIQFDKTPSCDNDGTIQVNALEGLLPYNYSWSDDPNENDSFRSGLSSNFYTVTVTDANNCSATATVFIKDLDAIILEDMEYETFNSSCDEDDGILRINTPPSGGLPPFSYECSNGANGVIHPNNWTPIYNFAPGFHAITITDVVGCTVVQEFEIASYDISPLDIEFIDHTCQGEEVGFIGLEYSQYTILWSNGMIGNLNEDLAAGEYTYTVTNNEGCTASETIEIETIDHSINPIIITSIAKNDCESEGQNTGEINLQIEGGAPHYKIMWNNGQTTESIDGLSAGTYTVTVTDKCGVEAVHSVIIGSDQISIDIDVEYYDFGENILVFASALGGSAPYDFEWNTGSTSSFLSQVEYAKYTVTVTDQNGCSKSKSVEVRCDPSDFTYITPPNCASPFNLDFATNQNLGPGPFKIKIEKKVNQEFEVVDYRVLPTISDVASYAYMDDDAGYFKVTATNYCGYTQTDIFDSCVDCDYYFFEDGGNNYASVMGGQLIFKLECPCSNDCGFLGFTTDKVKLLLNHFKLKDFQNSITGSQSFKITWPSGPSSNIYFNVNQNKFTIYGPSEYVLSDSEYDAGGITASVSMTFPFGQGVVCSLDIPFDFGQQGYNGYFYKWDIANPFSNYQPPYNWGTSACLHECSVPLVTGELYNNEPINYADMLENYYSLCDISSGTEEFFLYQPNDYSNPCQGGGRVISHVETPIGIVSGELIIPSNVALDQHVHWPYQTMIEDNDNIVPYTCPPHEWEKGYCLFDSEDVYGDGIKLRDPLIMSYCRSRFYDPPIDTDGDGIPDDEDPCPFNPDVFCDGNDAGNGDDDDTLGGDIDANGCQTTFFPDQCRLAIVCPETGTTYVDGVVQEESYSGIEPCVHCFTVDVCRVTHPDTGEEYAAAVGPISGSVDVSLGDIPACGNVCAILFHCSSTGAYLGYICAADCLTANNPLCGYNELNEIVALLQSNNAPASIQMDIPKELVNQIINQNRSVGGQNSKIDELVTIPNPSSRGFTVEYISQKSFSTQLKITNIYKEVVHAKEININIGTNNILIDYNLIPGIYIVSINNFENIISTKHVVQN